MILLTGLKLSNNKKYIIMRKLFLLLLVQISFLGTVVAQTGERWYFQDFSSLTDLDNFDDGRAIWDTAGATTTSTHWVISGWEGYTDVLYMAVDATLDNMQDEVVTANIDLPSEEDLEHPPDSVPKNYYLNFEWWSDMRNLGDGTDPELDPDAAITIEARFYQGTSWLSTWTEIWSEDDQTRLEETTTISLGGDVFDWDDYVSGVTEGWYTSEIDFTDIAVAGGNQPDSIQLRITYKGINAGEFGFDNLDIRYEAVPDYEVDIRLTEDYSYIPWLFAKDMNIDFIATVTQNTDSTFDETDARVELRLGTNLAGFTAMKNTDFSSGNVHEYTFTNIVAEFPDTAVGPPIDINVSVRQSITVAGSDEELFIVDSIYRRDNDDALSTYLNGDFSTPGIGVLYEVKNAEHFSGVNILFKEDDVDFRYDLIKVSGVDATSGEVIYSADTTTATDYNDKDKTDDIILEAGYYIIMVNQLTADSINLIQDNQNDGFYYRGTASNLTKIEDEGWPMIRMLLQPNRAPKFSDGGVYEHTITEGQPISYVVYTEDDDGDILGFRRIDPEQTWLIASWLSIVDNGDTTFTISGTPTETGSFEFDMRIGDAEGDSVTKTFEFIVLDPNPLPFVENFNATDPYTDNEGWTIIEDAAGNGSEVTWEKDKNDGFADDEFKTTDDEVVEMFGEDVAQEEWFVSPGISIPELSADSDSTVLLEFAYRLDWKYFVGPEMGNDNDGYDAGDVSVLISDDGGVIWSDPIWKEDDADIMLATTIYDEGATADDDDDTYIDSEDWPAYANGEYNLSKDEYFLSRIDISSYAGENIWIAFKYESDGSNDAVNAKFWLDFVDVKLIEPGVKLVTMAQNTTGYTMIPYFQAQDVSMMAKITNLLRHDITGGVLEAMVVDGGTSETVYFENTTFDVDGEDTTSVTLVTDYTPMVTADNLSTHTFTFTAKYNHADLGYFEESDNYTINYTNNEYAVDNNSFDYALACEEGEFVSMKFDIYKEDNLREFKLYIYSFTSGNDLSFTLVKDGVVIYNSPSYEGGTDFTTGGWNTFDIEDFKIQPGTYYLMVKTEESGTLAYGVDDDSDGFYYRGLPANIGVDTLDTGNLMLRMSVGNDAPTFYPAIADQEATVGVDFLYNISATDDNSDSLTFILESKPVWVTFENKNDGNRALITGTPTAGDVGSNLVQIGVFDDRDTIRQFFTIDVQESPAPIFLTAPGVIANEGIAYSYTAIGSDPFGDDVTVSSEILPSWLSDTVSTNGDTIVITGTPVAANVGEHQVKLNVTDEFGMTKQQAFEITVKANVSPEFITFGPVEGNEDIIYTFDIVVSDDNENDILTITGTTLPGWLTFTDNGDGTAVLTGTPLQADVGANAVGLSVTDNLGLSDAQTYTILVYAVNDAPVFTSTQSNDTLQAGKLFSSTITVTDAENDNIMFNTDMPTWLLLTNQGDGKALLRGMPMLEALGSNSVTIVATDGQAEVSQSFTIEVIDTTSAPKVAKENDAKGSTNNLFEFVLDATDDDSDEISFKAEDMPEWLVLAYDKGSAMFTGTPIEEETYSFAVDVSDGLHTVVSILNIDVSAESITGIEDISGIIKIYPNPAGNYITVTNVQGAKVSVYTIVGEKVLEIDEVESNEAQIDLSGLNEGTYIINIYHGEEIILRKINIIR